MIGCISNFIALDEELAKVTEAGAVADKGGAYNKVYAGLYAVSAGVLGMFFMYDVILIFMMEMMDPSAMDKPGWSTPNVPGTSGL